MPDSPRRRRRPPPPHGTARRYRYWRCHCLPCRDAERIRAKRHREGRGVPALVDATGTSRRVQALVAYGHPFAELARRLGCTEAWLRQLARAVRTRGVLRRTAGQVAALFDQLTALPPPAGRTATHARTVAARYGWATAWAWDDIDDPAERPKGVRTTRAGVA